MRVPSYESRYELRPTEVDPRDAAAKGSEIVDLGEGISALGERIQKLDDKRQTLKAQTYLAREHLKIRQLAATDPDIDTLDQRVDQMSQDAVSQASELIKSGDARNNFVAQANLDIERRNVSVYNTILRRKSQDFKNELVNANDADIQEYQGMVDPDERKLTRQRIIDRTTQAIQDGHVNADWAKAHVYSLLKAADLNQVKSDMAMNPTATYEQLQKGQDGLYPYLNEGQRKQFTDRAQKLIEKEGSDNKLIYATAQNNAESQLLEKMGKGQLTQIDINNAQTFGMNGIRIRPQFAKAASDAMSDPFTTESVPDKYNKLIDMAQNTDVDSMKLKMDVLSARGLTLQEKAHILNAHLREDPVQGQTSINDMIAQGIQKNRQALMQSEKNLQQEIKNRQSFLSEITKRFRNQAKDDEHLMNMQKDYMSKLQNVKDDQERMKIAQAILNHDTLVNNPGISTSDPKGSMYVNKITGEKRRYFPNGFWQLDKDNGQQ